jgi:hypothetical protein
MGADRATFWIDRAYDRDQASDGVSRYGAYIRQAASVAECWDGTWDDAQVRRARFAEAAWATATGPVMAPGYVRHHPRVLRGRVAYNAWDGTLNGLVRVVTPWPQALAQSRAWHSGGARWRDWPVESFGGRDVLYREPGEDEAAGHRYLMASAALIFPLPIDGLPAAPSGPGDDVEDAAREAVRVLVTAMNAVVTPVIEALEQRA